MSWINQPLTLFHGTTLARAKEILLNGIDLSKCRANTDFGRGFYTTTNLRQASDFALTKAEATRSQAGAIAPAVLRFDVDRRRLGALANLCFTHDDERRTQYWSFVEYCRKGKQPHIPGGQNYQVVYGPVAQWPIRMTPKTFADYDQVSFHNSGIDALGKPTLESIAEPRPIKRYSIKVGRKTSRGILFKHLSMLPSRYYSHIAAAHSICTDIGREDLRQIIVRIARSPHSGLFLHYDPRHLVIMAADNSDDVARQVESVSAGDDWYDMTMTEDRRPPQLASTHRILGEPKGLITPQEGKRQRTGKATGARKRSDPDSV